MAELALHDFHQALGVRWVNLNGEAAPGGYRSTEEEYAVLTSAAGVLDLGFRGRFCLLGQDREKFLHGQVTNDVLGLKRGEGTYAALVDAKAKLVSDLVIYKLAEELLLDFEPGLSGAVRERLEKYIIAEDVQVVDVAPHYGLLSVHGPDAHRLVSGTGWFQEIPTKKYEWRISPNGPLGEAYLMNHPRLNTAGFDLFVPLANLNAAAEAFAKNFVGYDAFEIARIENAIPRFGVDMDSSNLAPEAGIASRAISYSKGCYIGQEIIARIRTYGQVAKALRLLKLPQELSRLPQKGEKLFSADGKEVGYITSSTLSPKYKGAVALGYARKEVNTPGSFLHLGDPKGGTVTVLDVPLA